MSKEEAIKELTELLPEEFLSKYTEAIKMGIEALEQQPCEDCISRQAAINAAIEAADEWDGGGNRNREKIIEKALEQLPSVTAQPKIGKWIMSDDGLYRPICNNCGAHPWKGYIPTVEEATEAFKYCPHCGCAMQEVEE